MENKSINNLKFEFELINLEGNYLINKLNN